MKQVFKGKFRIESHRGQLEFHTLEGLEFDVSTDIDVPLEVVGEATFEDDVLIEWKRDNTFLAAPSSPTVALVKVLRPGQVADEDDIEATARNAKRIQDEYRRMGLVDITVKPHVLEGYDGSYGLRNFNWRFLEAHLREIDPDTWYTHYHGWGSFEGGICGRAWVGGKHAWTYTTCGYQTMIHEQGHNFRLHHAGTPSSEYGERDAYMGSGRGRYDMNAPHLYELGVIDPEDVKTINPEEAGTFFLAQPSKNTMSLPPGVDKIIRVFIDYQIFSVSYYGGQIRIHTPESRSTKSFKKTHLHERLDEPGDSVEFGGATIEYVEERYGVGKVVVKNRNDNVVDKPWPEFVVPENNTPITTDFSGIWRNTAWSAQGVHVRYLSEPRNELFVGWLSWDGRGNPKWFWSVMSIDNNNFASGPLRTGKEAEIVGEAEMYFYDTERGNFRAKTDEIGYFTFPVTRLSRSVVDDINGFYGIGDGNGLSLELTDRDTIAGYIYTYEDTSNVYNPQGVKPQWKLVLGEWGQPLTVYDVEGGVLGTKTEFETIENGTLKIGQLLTDGIVYWNGQERTANRLA